MKIVVVAGQGRKAGKTSVAAGLIRSSRHLQWTAVKISTHGPTATHGMDHAKSGFELAEETAASGSTDTGRFLAAGARRAFWLRATPDSLSEALASLLGTIRGAEHVLLESGSALELIRPRVGIVVTNSRHRTTKWRARRALTHADAVVVFGASRRLPPASGVCEFTMSGPIQINPALARFVRGALRRMMDSQLCLPNKEAACRP